MKPTANETDIINADSFNENLSARPKTVMNEDAVAQDPDLVEDGLDFGASSVEDAQASGYTDLNGKAIDKARADKPGHPTGAYTDLGAGRSSVVKGH